MQKNLRKIIHYEIKSLYINNLCNHENIVMYIRNKIIQFRKQVCLNRNKIFTDFNNKNNKVNIINYPSVRKL